MEGKGGIGGMGGSGGSVFVKRIKHVVQVVQVGWGKWRRARGGEKGGGAGGKEGWEGLGGWEEGMGQAGRTTKFCPLSVFSHSVCRFPVPFEAISEENPLTYSPLHHPVCPLPSTPYPYPHFPPTTTPLNRIFMRQSSIPEPRCSGPLQGRTT